VGFNINLCLLTAARGNLLTNPNGTLFNVIMAILLITSYVSSSLVFIPVQAAVVEDSLHDWWNTCVFAVPVLMLGTTLLLQAIIAMAAISQTRLLTWSSGSRAVLADVCKVSFTQLRTSDQ
jgi:energy-converting hydrogenase Eha subunit A